MVKMFEALSTCADDKTAGEQLEHICRKSVTIARTAKPPVKKNKLFHEGWSPIFIALRAQLICMINIRRGLCGYRHVYWDEKQRTQNITTLIDRWRGIVDRFILNPRRQNSQ